MTISRTACRRAPAILPLCLLLTWASGPGLQAQAALPPSEPPADWGPISINIEGIVYPHPVEFLTLNLYGQDVRIAYMDVAPVGPPNGRTVVLLDGRS